MRYGVEWVCPDVQAVSKIYDLVLGYFVLYLIIVLDTTYHKSQDIPSRTNGKCK